MLIIQKGANFEHEHQFTNERTGAVANILGYSTNSFILRDRIGGTLIATGTATISDGANGICLVTLTIAQTSAMTAEQKGVCSIEVGDGVDFRHTYEDTFYVRPETAT
jgi:hypothetical protein